MDPHGISTPSAHPRRRQRRTVIAGVIITGLTALAVPAIALWTAVNNFAQPAQHDAEITKCGVANGRVSVEVSVTNLSPEQQSFTVFVQTKGPVLNRTLRSLTMPVDNVPPNGARRTAVDFASTTESVTCTIIAVAGPLPFGVDLGPVGVQN